MTGREGEREEERQERRERERGGRKGGWVGGRERAAYHIGSIGGIGWSSTSDQSAHGQEEHSSYFIGHTCACGGSVCVCVWLRHKRLVYIQVDLELLVRPDSLFAISFQIVALL